MKGDICSQGCPLTTTGRANHSSLWRKHRIHRIALEFTMWHQFFKAVTSGVSIMIHHSALSFNTRCYKQVPAYRPVTTLIELKNQEKPSSQFTLQSSKSRHGLSEAAAYSSEAITFHWVLGNIYLSTNINHLNYQLGLSYICLYRDIQICKSHLYY